MSGYLDIPDGVEQYIDRVTRRCDSLISAQIWSDIERNKLGYWLKSFNGIEEQYFSALILDSLIYRSKNQTRAMMVQAIQRLLPELLRPACLFEKNEGKWLDIVRKSGVPVRFVPVIRKNDGPNKSGHAICREYGGLLGVNNKIVISPEDIEKEKKNGARLLIFVDDFLGTGNQFKGFYDEIESSLEGIISVYLPLCAHETGLNKVKEECPRLMISSADLLTNNDRFIKADDDFLPDMKNKYAALRELYHSLLEKRLGQKIDDPEGYGNLGLVYGFHNATPNATLPLLWSRKNKNVFLLVRN